MKVKHLPYSPEYPILKLEAEMGEYRPNYISYKHNDEVFIYERKVRKDKNGNDKDGYR